MEKYFQDKLIVHQTKAANDLDLIYYNQVNLQTAINKLAYFKKETKVEAINPIHTGGVCFSTSKPVNCSELQNETSYNLETL